MDDLRGSRYGIPFIVRSDRANQSVLDKDISKMTLDSVLIPQADNLYPSRGLTGRDMDQQ